jgi:hypothetical protein
MFRLLSTIHFSIITKSKKISLFFFFVLVYNLCHAQYYYKDLITNNQLSADMKIYKENKVRKIIVKSFEENGEESEGFFCEKKISKDYKSVELLTKSNFNYASIFNATYNDQGKLLHTKDSSDLSVTEIYYNYENNLISNIVSTIRSKDDDFENSIMEEHIYFYEDGFPTKMIKVKNKKDSIAILFSKDEQGNIGIEKDTKHATKYYYYYDDKKRLTDIVPATEYTQNLKPDYIFAYNNTNQITQMTSVEEGSSNYFVWKYTYDNGLRIKEKCYSNERRLMGSIEYEYK